MNDMIADVPQQERSNNKCNASVLVIYRYRFIQGWVQVISDIILSNVTPSNNLLQNSYFKNFIV